MTNTPSSQTPNQAKLADLIGHHRVWGRLVGLPDEICAVLCEYAIAIKDRKPGGEEASKRLYVFSQLSYEQIGQILKTLEPLGTDFESLEDLAAVDTQLL